LGDCFIGGSGLAVRQVVYPGTISFVVVKKAIFVWFLVRTVNFAAKMLQKNRLFFLFFT
jgi:hypothetical protein